MLHPALARALATAHIEDQLRAAARWHDHPPRPSCTSHAWRRPPIAVQRSASTRLRGLRPPRPTG